MALKMQSHAGDLSSSSRAPAPSAPRRAARRSMTVHAASRPASTSSAGERISKAKAPAPALKRSQSSRTVSSSTSSSSNSSKRMGSGTSTLTSGTSLLKMNPFGKQDEQTQSYPSKPNQSYFFFTGFPFPLGPTFKRNTVRTEVEKDTIWVFEQTQALEFVDVYTPLRMTVIKLKSGGLWVHAPCAPTAECIQLIKELDAPVEYIVLPTFAYEHKAFVGPFSRKFPDAEVYVGPDQWSFPLNLPNEFFGIFGAKTIKPTVPGDPDPIPWTDEIEAKPLPAPAIVSADFIKNGETAFFHKRTRTLLMTDAVVYIPSEPAKVIPKQALLALGKDNWLARYRNGGRSKEETEAIGREQLPDDTPENRRRGWMRMSLLVLYFNPWDLLTPEASFNAISDRLIVPPVVETLVYSKFPSAVVTWIDEICAEWDFKQIIPCHFAGPVKATGKDLKNAYTFAYEMVEEKAAARQSAAGERLVAEATSPSGGIAGFLSNLLKGVGPVGGQEQKPRRVVEFPVDDISTLRELNKSLLSSGLIKGEQ